MEKNKKTAKKKVIFIGLIIIVIIVGLLCVTKCSNKTFKITFKDYDGTTIEVQEVKRGEIPVFEGTPLRESDDTYEYTFLSWDKVLTKANKDETDTAVYESTLLNNDKEEEHEEEPIEEEKQKDNKDVNNLSYVAVKYKSSDGNTKSITLLAGTTIKIEPGSGSITGSSSITLTKNQALDLTSSDYTPTPVTGYAFKGYTYDSTDKKFTAEYGVTVTFDVQGHGIAPATQTIDINGKADKPTDPTDPNFVFEGWYKEAACTNEWNFTTDQVPTNTTLYAKWVVTVTFDVQGHGTAPAPLTTIDINSKVTKPSPDPTAAGYVFKGWYKEAACINAWNFDSDTVSTNTTLYAKWVVTVTFNVQEKGTAPDSQEIMDGSKVSKPADPTADGYVFKGWYKEATCETEWNFDSDTVSTNTTLYAKWQVTVTFDVQGKGTAPATQTIDINGKADKPTDPTAAGYVFKGWYKEADCTNEWNFDSDTVSTNTTLYAKWQVTVTFDVQGHGTAPAPLTTIDINSKVTKPSTDPTAAGYVFKGWYKEAACTNAWDFTTDTVSTNTTLYAKWQVIVTFDAQDVSRDPEDQTLDINGKVIKPEDPTCSGYIFKGWYKEAACINEWDFTTDTVPTNTTLYARWQVTVTFDVQGHGTAPEKQIIDVRGKATRPTDPVCDGYVFMGWYQEPACEYEWYFGRGIIVSDIVYAKWQVAVTFDVQGKGSAPEQQIINIDGKATRPTDPVCDGYVFMGWYKEAACINEWDFTTDTVPTNRTLYAKWQVAVTFDVQGKGSAPEQQIIDINGKATKPNDPSCSGCEFKGWYKEAACTNAWDFTTDTVPTNTTLYAKWQVTVTFDVQGHGTAPVSQIIIIGSTVTKPTDPVCSGYVFKGWYKEEGCTNAWDFTIDTVSSNITLYAKWQVTVTFDVQDHGSAPEEQTLDINGKATKPTDPTCSGYVFKGWYKEAACINAWDFTTDTVPTNTTLYAKWQVTVTFDAQDHGTAPEEQTLDINGKATKPTDPTYDGCVFKGWYKEAACINEWDFTTDTVSTNTTLYAKWVVIVTFNVQGHGSAPDSQTIVVGSKATKPTDPTCSGYVFKGWYQEAACTNAWDFNTKVPTNTTIYAKWITALSDKILNAKTIYTDGELECLGDSSNSIININGIDCYVLKVEGNKAELITKGIYDLRYNDDGSNCYYYHSSLKTWMDNYYTNVLKEGHDSEAGDENAILETTVTYYCDGRDDDLSTYEQGTVSQKVFALDAVEAQANAERFVWGYTSFIDDPRQVVGFWVTAAYHNPYKASHEYHLVTALGSFDDSGFYNAGAVGARPAFWISLD